MLLHEGVRSFQKQMTKYINGNDIVIIEDGKTNHQKGVYMPFAVYTLFQQQLKDAIREDIKNSFTENFDGSGTPNEY